MKLLKLTSFAWIFLVGNILTSGCSPDTVSTEKKREESPSGASFKAGEGITLTDETRKILQVETAEVTEEKLPKIISFSVQVFSDSHRFSNSVIDHTLCDIHGSGFLPSDKAIFIKAKQPVELTTSHNETLNGFVAAVGKTLTHGENEIIVGITNTDAKLKDGEFVSASVALARDNPVMVIPGSAILKTLTGTFVYTVNGRAYYRTAVKIGSESGDKAEITEGLYPGDQVVTTPVETLWLIELRATKGGGHCH